MRRVGVIGPGLDFTDKAEGYDSIHVDDPAVFRDQLAATAWARQGG